VRFTGAAAKATVPRTEERCLYSVAKQHVCTVFKVLNKIPCQYQEVTLPEELAVDHLLNNQLQRFAHVHVAIPQPPVFVHSLPSCIGLVARVEVRRVPVQVYVGELNDTWHDGGCAFQFCAT